MAERVVKVSLRADINNYLSGMEQARKKTQETGSEAEKTAAKLQQQKEAFNLLGGTLLAAGTLAAAAVGVAVKKWMDFDQAMSAVAAATHETSANMGRLRDAALEAGARTVFSATEAANAIEELGKASLTTDQILSGGLDGALDLAAASGMGVADAATAAAIAMKQFGLNGKDVPHIADLLAAGAGKAVGEVSDLSMALNQAGLVANGAGQSIEGTTGVLAAFADAGLLGSDAGTSLKSAIIALQAPTDKARAEMEKYNLSFYDGNGKMLTYQQIAGQLETNLGGLSDETRNAALAQIFGNDALRSANVLYEQGQKGIQQYIDQTNDAGYAAETAAARLDNLAGDWEQFGGAVETASIKAGEAADGPLRTLVQAGTEMVTAWSDVDPVLQQGALAVAAVGAAVAVTAGLALLGVPKIADYRAALATLGTTSGRVAKGAAGAGIALAALTLIVTQLASQQAEARAKAEAYADTLEQGTNKVTDATREMVVQNLQAKQSLNVLGIEVDAIQFDSAADGAEKLGLNVSDVTDAAMGSVDALERVAEVTKLRNRTDAEAVAIREKLGLKEGEFADAIDSVINGVKGESTSMDEAIRLAKQKTEATEESVSATNDNSAALAELSGAAADTKGSIGELAESIRGFGAAELDTRDAAREFQDALAALDESVIANGTSLDITTEAGRSNEAALDGIARAALASAGAIAEQTGSEDLAAAAVDAGRQQLILKLAQFGITGQAAEDYADKLGLIPGNVDTAVVLNKTQAEIDLDNWVNQYRVIHIDTRVATGPGGTGGQVVGKAHGGIVDYYARGGIRENHVAQIAPAGSWRVWAEPETGGEAYIPFAPSKRARSLEVWAETGGRLGVPGFADGAAMPPVYAQQRWTSPTQAKTTQQSLDGMRISGRLDLGNGLTGMIDGRIESALSAEEFAHSTGFGGVL
ncbi:phage tail tape measure protein [Agromyces aureus]|uniref:Phage tail tape measure protein domain-containing protein n=1 Tax=Agromyces aureus TaxID=453304 RepID=A0A191WF69_9MICO|nr:phage tail tape measure protein [Agromyces aureus]ANJ26824.1 hypothetical protein ATC03_08930 [Agromyces aureus]